MSGFHMKFSAIAHRSFRFCNPVQDAKMQRLIELIDLRQGAGALDVGCGKAELLIRLAEQRGIRGVGVELNPHFLGEAEAAIGERAPGLVHLVEGDAKKAIPAGPYDMSICMGARPFGETYESTIRGLKLHTRPGGLMLLGEGYWMRRPSRDVLEFLDTSADSQASHAGNVTAAVALGLTPLYNCAASLDDWDHYEGRYLYNIERYCELNPEDPDLDRMLERIRAWHRQVLTLLRGTLGYGLYLFRV